jgi:hypothetical protein
VESRHSHQHPTGCSQPEIRLVDPIEIAVEGNAAWLLPASDSQRFQLARRY